MILSALLVISLVLTAQGSDGANADGEWEHAPAWSPKLMILFILINILGMIGEVTNQAQTLAIEKDWVVEMANRDSKVLQTLNVEMRRIDLSCKVSE